jgi:hypothetical protein
MRIEDEMTEMAGHQWKTWFCQLGPSHGIDNTQAFDQISQVHRFIYFFRMDHIKNSFWPVLAWPGIHWSVISVISPFRAFPRHLTCASFRPMSSRVNNIYIYIYIYIYLWIVLYLKPVFNFPCMRTEDEMTEMAGNSLLNEIPYSCHRRSSHGIEHAQAPDQRACKSRVIHNFGLDHIFNRCWPALHANQRRNDQNGWESIEPCVLKVLRTTRQ